ncbi:MAG: ribonuclease III, partial [Terriglobia bacterium]
LTHSSYAREAGGDVRDNEQLEFLGDAVLNFVVSSRLADAFPGHSEGQLSRARARLVGAEHLSVAAFSLKLGSYLLLGLGEEKTGGRSKSRLAVNALESLVAALYRDGGLPAAEHFISRFILPSDLRELEDQLLSVDYKSALQERLQTSGQDLPCYRVVSEEGPEHRKQFVVEVGARDAAARGRGDTKKLAEQEAARGLLEILKGRSNG